MPLLLAHAAPQPCGRCLKKEPCNNVISLLPFASNMARLTPPLFVMAGAALLALGIADTEGLSATGSTKGFFRLQATRDSCVSMTPMSV